MKGMPRSLICPGKELIARAIHELSRRKERTFATEVLESNAAFIENGGK